VIVTPCAPRIPAHAPADNVGFSIQLRQGHSQWGHLLLTPLHPANGLGARHSFGKLNSFDGSLFVG
jgi:hypothetical protein